MELIFNIIENFIGSEIKPKTLKKLKKLSNEQALELTELIKHVYEKNYYFVDSDKLPEFSHDEVRHAVLTDQAGAIDSWEIWNNTDYLKKLLLYYPKISVLDPIDDVLPSLLDLPQMFRLDEPLSLLLPVRKLIKKDIIRLVPGNTANQTVFKQIDIHPIIHDVFIENDIFEAIRAYEPDTYDMIINLNLDMPGFALNEREVLRALVRKGVPYSLLTYSASIIKRMYVKFTIADLTESNIAFISEKEPMFFTKLLGSNTDVMRNLGKKDDFIGQHILSLSLPDIYKLGWEDIMEIRSNDEDFYLWRKSFKNVLKEAYKYNNFSKNDFFINAKEILSAESRSLRNSLKQKQSLKNKFIESLIPAGIGFASGALTGAIETAATSGVVTGSLSLLFSLFAKRPHKSEEALYRHFSIFLNK